MLAGAATTDGRGIAADYWTLGSPCTPAGWEAPGGLEISSLKTVTTY